MSSREEFEAWLSSEYPWGNKALDKAFFSGNDDNGYYTGGDFIYDGSSCADALFWAWRGWQESHKQGKTKCAALAAENAGLKESDVPLGAIENGRAFADRLEVYPFECDGGNINMCSDWQELRRCFEHLSEWAMHSRPETPATDAYLAEVRAQARNEGINYAAGRLAAAFNHGYVDKPLAEVCDVVRMIMDTKEELANSTPAAADGLSGEYAEKFLAEFAAQLRQGVQS